MSVLEEALLGFAQTLGWDIKANGATRPTGRRGGTRELSKEKYDHCSPLGLTLSRAIAPGSRRGAGRGELVSGARTRQELDGRVARARGHGVHLMGPACAMPLLRPLRVVRPTPSETASSSRALMLAVSLSIKLVQALGAAGDSDLSQRLTMVILGVFFMFTGNAMPKMLTPLSVMQCNGATDAGISAIRRVDICAVRSGVCDRLAGVAIPHREACLGHVHRRRRARRHGAGRPASADPSFELTNSIHDFSALGTGRDTMLLLHLVSSRLFGHRAGNAKRTARDHRSRYLQSLSGRIRTYNRRSRRRARERITQLAASQAGNPPISGSRQRKAA